MLPAVLADLPQILSAVPGREVRFAEARHTCESPGATAEEYWPDMEGLDFRDTVTNPDLPAETFFDLAFAHLLTTATIDRLRVLYPQGRFEVRRFQPNIAVSTGRMSGASPRTTGSVTRPRSGPGPACGPLAAALAAS